jgi:putative membrane protein
MKRLTFFVSVAGLFAATFLVLRAGADEVGTALSDAGWTAVLVLAVIRASLIATAGAGWSVLFPPAEAPRLRVCVGLRFVREAINTLLPVAQVGGDLAGARLLTFWGVPGSLAGASVVVDVLIQALTQFLFTLIGLGFLVALGGDEGVVRTVALGLCVAGPALVAFYLVQRRTGQKLLRMALERFAGERDWRALGAVEALYDRLAVLYADKRRVLLSTVVHLAGWILGAAEIWAALWLLGHPVALAEALVIESLVHAIRGAAFAVPGAIGVQEGGLIALCAIFGVPMETALALALLKRVADLSIGLPGLLAWQALEGRILIRADGRAGTVPEGAGPPLSSAANAALLSPGGPRAGEPLLGG